MSKKVKLTNVHGEWKWICPVCNSGTFTYSADINREWNNPVDKVFCGVCGSLFDFKKESE